MERNVKKTNKNRRRVKNGKAKKKYEKPEIKTENILENIACGTAPDGVNPGC